jgi:DNA anti-recombination protein RmuC
MTDNTIKEDDELIPVETPPEEEEQDSKAEADTSEEDDEEDERLAESDEESEEEIRTGRNRRRQRRRDIHRRAKETAEEKIRLLEQQNADMLRRLASVEGHALNNNAQTLEERLAKAQRDVQQAEHFIAKATEAGNG